MRTLPALKQVLYAALTSTPLAYAVNAGPTQTVPVANVFGAAPVDIPNAPDPMVSVTVSSRGRESLELAFRPFEIKVSVSSAKSDGEDLVTEIYSAIVERLESPSADGVHPLTRVATAQTLPITIATIREVSSLPAGFDKDSSRWYVTGTLSAVAR